MKKITDLNELKKIELGVLLDVAEFCSKHDITYYLGWGTLIGAIRHKGFIPWDDDIDIMMPRNDYDRFLKEYRSENCSLKKPFDKSYVYPFAKVYDSRTVLKENTMSNDEIGVYVDVFPLDGLPDSPDDLNKHCKKIYFWKSLLKHKYSPLDRKRSLPKKMIIPLAKIALKPISYKYICSKIDYLTRKYSYMSSENIGNNVWGYNYKNYKKAWMEPAKECVFEGYIFKIPNNFDAFLRANYGDYMQLPPKEKQVSKHDFEAFWK